MNDYFYDEKPKHKPKNEPFRKSRSMFLVGAMFAALVAGLVVSLLFVAKPEDVTFSGQNPPVINALEIREVWEDEVLVIYTDIHFSDADGDASRLELDLLEATREGASVWDGIITVRPAEQRAGATHTFPFDCQGTAVYTLGVRLIDQNSNSSKTAEHIITCRVS